jgi:uncharacterized protein YoxC
LVFTSETALTGVVGCMPTRPEDEIEARVQNALKQLPNSPEINELRAAVGHLIEDRRKLQDRVRPSVVDEVVEEVGQAVEEITTEAEKAMEALSEKSKKLSEKSKTFFGDLRQAVDRFKS